MIESVLFHVELRPDSRTPWVAMQPPSTDKAKMDDWLQRFRQSNAAREGAEYRMVKTTREIVE